MKRSNGLALVASASAAVLVLAGCSSAEAGGEEAAATTYMAADGSCAAGPADGIDFETANARMTSFQEPFAELEGLEPLNGPIEEGISAVYLNNGTPVAALFQASLQVAVEAAGIEFVNVDTGTDAQSINSALNTVVSMAPEIVFDQSIDATFFPDQVQQLVDGGTTFVYGGQVNAADFNLVDSLGGLGSTIVNSEVLASSAVALTCGTVSEFVFYNVPELPASQLQGETIVQTITDLCPECTVRVVDISLTDANAVDSIVSDLQANPQTQFFVSMADQFQLGLQQKAELAGITNAYGIGQSSLPTNMQQIAEGSQVAGYTVDFDLFMWLQVDEAVRRMQGMDVPYLEDFEAAGQMLSRVATSVNIDAMLEPDYQAVPGMQEQLLELWGR